MSEDKGNVVSIAGASSHLHHGGVAEDVIAELERMLADARSGFLRAIATVEVTVRAINTGWAGHCDLHQMIAGVSILNYRILADPENQGA